MKPLNLREFGESLRAAGNEWGDQIIEACDAQEVVDVEDDLETHCRESLENHGCVEGEEYETSTAVERVCHRDERVAAFLEQQDDNWWHDATQQIERLENGVAALEQIRCKYEAIEEQLTAIGILDGSPDPDIPAILAMLLGG